MRGGAAAVVLAILAGCVNAAEPSDTSATEAGPDNAASQATGVRGVVTDDSLAPIEGAMVNLDGPTAANATTLADGSYEILGLEPGHYSVFAGKIGYESVGRKVDVLAGETAELRFTLAPIAVDESYHLTQTKAGIVLCGMNTGSPSSAGNACILIGQLPQNDYDRSVLYWITNLVDASGYISETVFTPSTGLTKGMDLFWALLLDDMVSTPVFASGGNATSPVTVQVLTKAVLATAKANPAQSCRPDKMGECRLVSFHYLRGGVVDGVSVGVAVNQRYEVWRTVFYKGDVPEVFTALPPK